MLRGPAAMETKCCGTPNGLEKYSRRSPVGICGSRNIYVVFWLCKIPKMMQIWLIRQSSKSEKAFSFRGVSPLTSHQEICPWAPLGVCPKPPCHRGLVLSYAKPLMTLQVLIRNCNTRPILIWLLKVITQNLIYLTYSTVLNLNRQQTRWNKY